MSSKILLQHMREKKPGASDAWGADLCRIINTLIDHINGNMTDIHKLEEESTDIIGPLCISTVDHAKRIKKLEDGK